MIVPTKAATEAMVNQGEVALIVVKMDTCHENALNLRRKEVADDLKNVLSATSSVTCHVTVPLKAMKALRGREWMMAIR